MKKRTLSLATLILLIAFVVSSFVGVTFYNRHCELIDSYFGPIYKEDYSLSMSFAELGGYGFFYSFLVYVCLLFAIIGIIAMILQICNKQSKTIDYLTFSPVISTVTFMIFCLFYMMEEPDYVTYGRWNHEIAWGFYVNLVLINAAAAISVLIATGGKKIRQKKALVNNRIDNPAEELLKYKEMLDNELISQEDFDAKKKQLLNL